jgi:hypothetical protein
MTAPTDAADRTDLDSLGPRLSVTVSPQEPAAGQTVEVTATLTNDCPFTLRRTVLHVARADTAAQVFPLGDLRPGTVTTRRQRFRLADDTEGTVTFTGHAVFDVTARSSDFARGTAAVTLPYLSLAGAFNNAGIADDSNINSADIDGSGSSLSAQALASVGCGPGAVVTHDGVSFTWPDTTPGAKDNVVCSGQTVLLSGSGSRLAFLGTSTWGEGKGDGTVIYTDGTRQPFSVAVKDWYGTSPDAAVVAPYRNVSWGRDDVPVSIFAFSVPLQDGKQPRAVVLPNVSPDLRSGVPALHIFAMTLASS